METSDDDTFMEIKKHIVIDDVPKLVNRIKEAEKAPKKYKSRLCNLKIILRHEVPPQHQLEHKITKVPSKEIREKFNSIITMKRGPFAPEEDQIIVNNWNVFCQMHKWKHTLVYPFINLQQEGVWWYNQPKRHIIRFVQFLADGLPERSLNNVYFRFRLLFRNHYVDRYSAAEDDIIISYLEDNPNVNEARQFSDLAKVLNRTRQSVWRRYKRLSKYNCEN